MVSDPCWKGSRDPALSSRSFECQEESADDLVMTLWARISWLGRHLRRSGVEAVLARSPQDVAAEMEGQLHPSFPSPKGEPVIAGSLNGGRVIRFRIRAYRHGAHVGMSSGQRNRAKPSLAGSIAPANGSSLVRYRVDAFAVSVTFFGLLVVAIVLAIVGAIVGRPLDLFLWIVAVCIAAFPAQILGSVAGAAADERFLLDWLVRVTHTSP